MQATEYKKQTDSQLEQITADYLKNRNSDPVAKNIIERLQALIEVIKEAREIEDND